MSLFLFQSKKGKQLSNCILGSFFLLLGLSIVILALTVGGYLEKYPLLVALDDAFILTYGPLLLFFTRSIIIKDFKLEYSNLLHFIPAFVLSIAIIFVLINSKAFLEGSGRGMFSLIEFVLLTHCIIYALQSRFEVNIALKKASNHYATIDLEHVAWVNFIINSFLIILATSLIHATTPLIRSNIGVLISLAIFILYLFVFVNRVVLRMLNKSSEESGIVTQLEQDEKYKGARLNAQEVAKYKNEITKYFEESQAYLNDKITLKMLSEAIGLSPKALSQVINSGFSMRFFDLINKYRIGYALDLLKERGTKLTIQEIMYQSGFSSKSSFNTAFKKITGKTPSAIKNEIEKGSTS